MKKLIISLLFIAGFAGILKAQETPPAGLKAVNAQFYINLIDSAVWHNKGTAPDGSKYGWERLARYKDLSSLSYVSTVTGTTNRITSTGGLNPIIDISAAYVGQSSITTLGTIVTGVWNGTAIAVANGGTGQTSYTNGQLLIGNTTGNTLTKGTLTGTSSQISVTNGAGSITLSIPSLIQPTAATTARSAIVFSNSGGAYYLGADNSAGNGLFATTVPPYSLGINVSTARPIVFGTNNIARAYFDATGGHFTPFVTATYDLGTSSIKWRDIYSATATLADLIATNSVVTANLTVNGSQTIGGNLSLGAASILFFTTGSLLNYDAPATSSGTITGVWGNQAGDDYLRKYSPATLKSNLGYYTSGDNATFGTLSATLATYSSGTRVPVVYNSTNNRFETEVGGGSYVDLTTNQTVAGNKTFTGTTSMTNGITLVGTLGLGVGAVSISGSTSGSAEFSFDFRGGAHRRILIYCNALLGTATYGFPETWAHTPSIIATDQVAAGVVTAISTTSVTITGATTTGFIILEGY